MSTIDRANEPLTTTPFNPRLEPEVLATIRTRVRELMTAEAFDALFTDDPDDVAYLTGFFHHPNERPVTVWLEPDRSLLLLPELEREHAESQHAVAELISYPEFPGTRSPWSVLADQMESRTLRVGFGLRTSVGRATEAQEAVPAADWRPTDLIGRARMTKVDAEIGLHIEAARITDEMLAAGVQLVRDAVTAGGELPSEAELASHVAQIGSSIMYGEHADVVVVSMLAGGLVYAASNSAHPHGLPSRYRLQPGDTFILSLGCAVGGRFIEGERTFVLGQPTSNQRRLHDAVREAQRVGAEMIRPGTSCSEANRRCLQVIRDAGLGKYLRHRQGHGIGLSMHEPPWLADGDDTPLAETMIVSNEPGIYVPSHAGYRISDSMLVTADGSRPLTTFPRDLDACTIEL